MISPEDAARIESGIAGALAASAHDEASSLAARYVEATRDGSPSGRPEESPWFRARYLAAQAELAAGRLGAALGWLESLAPIERALPAELAQRVHILAAEVLARLGRATEASTRLAQVRGVVHWGEPLPTRIQARALRVWLALGQVKQLGTEIVACEAALIALGETSSAVLLACDAGLGWASAGDLARAEECWLRAEQTATALERSDPARADALLQLGRLDHLRGHWQRALDRYRDALCTQAAGTVQGVEIRLRRALIYLELGQAADARDEYSAATHGWRDGAVCPEELRSLAGIIADLTGCPRMASVVHDPAGDDESCGFRRWIEGDLNAAREAYTRAFEATSAPERQARYALALGVTAIASRDPAADAWLLVAKELADRFDLPEVRWRSRQGLGRLAAEWRDDQEAARSWFEEAALIGEVQDESLMRLEDRAAHRQARGDVLSHLLGAAGRRGDAEGVLRYQELARGRHLLELWQSTRERTAGGDALTIVPANLTELDHRIEELDCELHDAAKIGALRAEIHQAREQLTIQRDRARDLWLADRSRRSAPMLPTLADLRELEQRLPREAVYVAPSLAGDDLVVLVVRPRRGGRVIRVAGAAPTMRDQTEAFRRALAEQLDRFRSASPLNQIHRSELDGLLSDFGRGPLGHAVATALAWGDEPAALLVWAPDAEFHGLPVSALRQSGRYLVEDASVVHTFSASLYTQQVRVRRHGWFRWRRRRLVVVAGSPDDSLGYAESEGRGILAAFAAGRLLRGGDATKAAVRALLPRARIVHFACHADIPSGRPHRARVELPSGERWYASEWPGEPIRDLPLVTLSACRSGEVASLFGREVFGLVSGVLGGGARAVVAGLWSVPDREAMNFMFAFYHHLMAHDPPTALAKAQREALRGSQSNPLFWSVFAVFGDPCALTPPFAAMRWWVRRRQARYLDRCRAIQQDAQATQARRPGKK
jgi:CHAT domain-containing protein